MSTRKMPTSQFDTLIDMVPLPAGKFRMGSPRSDLDAADDERPQHDVVLSAFEIGRTPVTQTQYQAVMGTTQYLAVMSTNPHYRDHFGPNKPVNYVSWYDAVAFCLRLSELAGRSPAYRGDGDAIEMVPGADGFRLPTEAEWEYACRAGSAGRHCFGDDDAKLGEYAWFDGNSEHTMHPVGKKKPNAFGLHDMHGSVWEWVFDWFGKYDGKEVTDPIGPPIAGRQGDRVLRGGSFWDRHRELRSAHRTCTDPDGRNPYIGFRCVRTRRLRETVP